jgi:hypothetical protein
MIPSVRTVCHVASILLVLRDTICRHIRDAGGNRFVAHASNYMMGTGPNLTVRTICVDSVDILPMPSANIDSRVKMVGFRTSRSCGL